MPIDRNHPIPLYFQLSEQIREQIESGQLVPGEQLPSERELGQQLGISRMTVRQAILYLVRQGRLEARQGIGTFVAEPKLTHDTWHLLGFTEEMLQLGQAARSQVIEQVRAEPPPSVAGPLELRPTETVTKIVRLRYSQDTPLLLETVYVPTALAFGLEEEDLSHASLYQRLEAKYGLQLDHARQSLETITANEHEAELFEIAFGTTLLLLEGVTYTQSGQPAEFFKTIYRGDKFRFEFESQRATGPTAQASLPRLSVVMR